MQLVAQRNLHEESMALVNFRPGLRNISKFGAYNVALKRNFSHTSASSAVAMLAGDEINGAFFAKSGAICTRYEERACRCQRVASMMDYECLDLNHAAIDDSDDFHDCLGSVEVIEEAGDATKQDSIT